MNHRVHTIALLFGLMVISAQFRLGGFYAGMVRRIAAHAAGPDTLLLWVVIAVMLLLPASTGPQAGAVLALASTLAGNLLIVGSVANIIVVEQAGRQGVAIDWRTHPRTGIPVTLATLAIGAAWLWIRAR